jgi:hypothetical protein
VRLSYLGCILDRSAVNWVSRSPESKISKGRRGKPHTQKLVYLCCDRDSPVFGVAQINQGSIGPISCKGPKNA